jgi:mannosyltransferase OCH1-like enzyme
MFRYHTYSFPNHSTYKETRKESFSSIVEDITHSLPEYTPNVITKRIFQTYHTISRIPSDVFENIAKYAPGYTHEVYDDAQCLAFLTQYFTQKVCSTFTNMKDGAHKADLVRYALLYVYGGVYLDIKTELILLMDECITHPVLYSVISSSKDHIYQGIIAAPPRLPIFLSLIQFMIDTGNPVDYHAFCKDFYHTVAKEIGSTPTSGAHGGYYLWEERCDRDTAQCYDGLDRWGLCCFVWDGERRIIKTRRASYPW